jgi:hypothetical protein
LKKRKITAPYSRVYFINVPKGERSARFQRQGCYILILIWRKNMGQIMTDFCEASVGVILTEKDNQPKVDIFAT